MTPKTDKASGESNAVNILREASKLDHIETVKNAFESGIHDNIPQREANRMYTWKDIAQMLDKCLMYTYILLFVIATAVCLGVLGSYKRT